MSTIIQYDERDGTPMIVTKLRGKVKASRVPDLYPSKTPMQETIRHMYEAGVIDFEEMESLYGTKIVMPQSHAYVRQTGGKKDGTDGQASVPGGVRRSGGRPRPWWERFIAYFDWLLGGKDRRGTAYW